MSVIRQIQRFNGTGWEDVVYFGSTVDRVLDTRENKTNLLATLNSMDEALSTASSNLINKIEEADTALQSNITDEATLRQQADETLQSNIDSIYKVVEGGAPTGVLSVYITENNNVVAQNTSDISSLSQKVSSLETTVGSTDSGLVKDVANLSTNVSTLQTDLSAKADSSAVGTQGEYNDLFTIMQNLKEFLSTYITVGEGEDLNTILDGIFNKT